MTSVEMLREFKVGIDKIDSESYPEIYPEQIFMFINKAIDELVNEGRRVFEKDQTITDNLKSLIPREPTILIPTRIDNEYLFDLSDIDYIFYIRSSARVRVGDIEGKANVNVTQQDDIEVILEDPHNKPKPHRIPITFSRDAITAYGDNDFEIVNLSLVYVKQPVKVDAGTNCDLDIQTHYSIVNRAIQLAEISLGINNKQ